MKKRPRGRALPAFVKQDTGPVESIAASDRERMTITALISQLENSVQVAVAAGNAALDVVMSEMARGLGRDPADGWRYHLTRHRWERYTVPPKE